MFTGSRILLFMQAVVWTLMHHTGSEGSKEISSTSQNCACWRAVAAGRMQQVCQPPVSASGVVEAATIIAEAAADAVESGLGDVWRQILEPGARLRSATARLRSATALQRQPAFVMTTALGFVAVAYTLRNIHRCSGRQQRKESHLCRRNSIASAYQDPADSGAVFPAKAEDCWGAHLLL